MQEMAALTKRAASSAAEDITVQSDHHINTCYIKCKSLFLFPVFYSTSEKVTHGI